MSWRKAWRVGIKWGTFIFIYERVVDKLKPVKQVEVTKQKQLKGGNIDTYT
jgi:hypothetical protein